MRYIRTVASALLIGAVSLTACTSRSSAGSTGSSAAPPTTSTTERPATVCDLLAPAIPLFDPDRKQQINYTRPSRCEFGKAGFEDSMELTLYHHDMSTGFREGLGEEPSIDAMREYAVVANFQGDADDIFHEKKVKDYQGWRQFCTTSNPTNVQAHILHYNDMLRIDLHTQNSKRNMCGEPFTKIIEAVISTL